MPRLTRIQHEGVPVRDLERSRAFYEQVLGLRSIPRPSFGAGGVWLADPSGAPQIHLIVTQGSVPGPEARPNPVGRHTAFLVEDYEGLKRRLEAFGATWYEIADGPTGVPQLMCVDPDGHTLEFQPAERYGDAVWAPGFEPTET